jgi:hypothetical protein
MGDSKVCDRVGGMVLYSYIILANKVGANKSRGVRGDPASVVDGCHTKVLYSSKLIYRSSTFVFQLASARRTARGD